MKIFARLALIWALTFPCQQVVAQSISTQQTAVTRSNPSPSAMLIASQIPVPAFSSNGGTLSGSTYSTTALGSLQPGPAHQPGMVITWVPQTTNPGAASFVIGSLSSQPIQKIVGSAAAALSGGELVAGVPVQMLDTGSAWILIQTGYSAVRRLSGAYTISAADWLNNVTIVATGTLTLTVNCALTYAPHGVPRIMALGQTVTVQVSSGCAPDYIAKNSIPSGSGTSVTLSTTADDDLTTDGSSTFSIGGP